jgi:hypothetical protein
MRAPSPIGTSSQTGHHPRQSSLSFQIIPIFLCLGKELFSLAFLAAVVVKNAEIVRGSRAAEKSPRRTRGEKDKAEKFFSEAKKKGYDLK